MMKNTTKLTISQWSEDDRPREKMMAKGAMALSDAERTEERRGGTEC